MSYTPNLSDPRIQRRIKMAYGFARAVMGDKPHSWSTRFIDKHFGQQQNDLSKWLRSQLLICVNEHFNKDSGKTKEYILNQEGADYIREVIRGSEPAVELTTSPVMYSSGDNIVYDDIVVRNWIQKEFQNELESGEFSYSDKSSRLWHPLQSVRKQYKRAALAENNLRYHFDIQCAAPTLIVQHAQQQSDPMDEYPIAVNTYLKDRTRIREELAQALEVDIKTTKVIINAMFCGARIGLNSDFAISQLLNNDPAKIEYLKQNEFVSALREEIKTCWVHITPSMNRTSILDKNNKERLLPITSKNKWQRYFDLERNILNAVIKFLTSQGYHYFLEHDGWACDRDIDVNELSDYVFGVTGYKVIFDRDFVL